MGYISSTPEVLDKLKKSKVVQCGSHVPAPSFLVNCLKPLLSVMQFSANRHVIEETKELWRNGECNGFIWLRHYVTSWKVVGSIPDIVIGILLWNPSSPTVALRLTQSLIEMSTGYISWGGKGGQCIGLTTVPPSCANCLKIWERQPPGTLRACPGL